MVVRETLDSPADAGRADPAAPLPPRPRRAIRSAWVGSALLAVVTLVVATGGSASDLFLYNSILLAVFGAVALNVLLGTTGLVSIGNSAFMAVGAFAAVFAMRAGIPFPGDVVFAAIATALAGLIVGLPALRLRGLYLALATLAAFFIVSYLGNVYQSNAAGAGSGGFSFDALFQDLGLKGGQRAWAWTLLVLVVLLILVVTRISHERTGRSLRMIRDHELAAQTLGIPVTRYKLVAFSLTSGLIGIQGALVAHMSGSVTAGSFTFALAVSYLAMVLIGGLDSVLGAVVGAALVTLLPVLLPALLEGVVAGGTAVQGPAISQIVYGALVVVFIVSSPDGLVGLSKRLLARLGRTGPVRSVLQRLPAWATR